MAMFRLTWLRFARGNSALGVPAVFAVAIQLLIFFSSFSGHVLEGKDTALRFGQLTDVEKSVTVIQGDPSQLGVAALNASVTKALSASFTSTPVHAVVYRPVSDLHSSRFQVVGLDALAEHVTVESGAIPQACSATHCEVFGIGIDSTTHLPKNFSITGTGQWKLSDAVTETLEPGVPVVVANSAAAITTLPQFNGFPGSEVWSTPLTDHTVAKWGVTQTLAAINGLTNQVNGLTSRTEVIAPASALSAISSATDVLIQRNLYFVVVLCVLMFVALSLLVVRSRKSYTQFVQQVRLLSGSQYRRGLLNIFHATLLTLPALFIAVACSLTTSRLLSGSTVHHVLILHGSFVGLTFLVAYFYFTERMFTRSVIGLLVIGIWVVISLNLGAYALLLILPIAVFTSSYLALSSRTIRNKQPVVRNLLLSNYVGLRVLLATCAFFVASGLSGVIWISSLKAQAIDSAAFQSPLTTRITMGGERQPLQDLTLSDYAELSSGGKAFPIQKLSSTYSQNFSTSFPTMVVGADLHLWQSATDVSRQAGENLTSSSDLVPSEVEDFGIDVSTAHTLSFFLNGLNPNARVGIWTLSADRESHLTELEQTSGKVSIEISPQMHWLTGLEITEEVNYKARREHAVAEGVNALPAPQGRLSISKLQRDEEPIDVPTFHSVNYNLITGPHLVSVTTKSIPLPALVDPETFAQSGGKPFSVDLSNGAVLDIKPIAIVNRLPTVPMRFTLVDGTSLINRLVSRDPGLVKVSEVWLTQPFSSENREPQLDGLTIRSQSDLITNNLSPTTVQWSNSALGYTFGIGLAALLTIALVVLRGISRDTQAWAWLASGENMTRAFSNLNAHLVARVAAVVTGTALVTCASWLLLIRLITRDLNGDDAYPPVLVHFDWIFVGKFIVGTISIVTVATHVLLKSATPSKPELS